MEKQRHRWALITGATSGIGFRMAVKLGWEGYGLLLVSSSAERLHEAEKKIMLAPVRTYVQDLSLPGGAEELYRRVTADGYTVDLLVNNAGVGLVGEAETLDSRREEAMLRLNILSMLTLTKKCFRDMKARGEGQILNVASVGAFQPGPYTASYYASKAFVLSYTRALRYEARGTGVKVNALCPGSTKTEFFTRAGTKTPLFAMRAARVAGKAWKGLLRDQEVIVPGLLNQLSRALPSELKMWAIAGMKRQSRKMKVL